MKAKIFTIVFIIFSLISFAQKRAFRLDDLYKVKAVSSPKLSPQNQQLLFTITEYNLKGGSSKIAGYTINADGTFLKKIETGDKNIFSPFWGKDDNTIYYLKSINGNQQLFQFLLDKKEERQITNFSMGISEPKFSNDGKYLAFSSEVYPECNAVDTCNKFISEKSENGPIQAYIADNLLFRHWTSYSEGKYSHIFIYDVHEQTYIDLTPGKFVSPTFSAGGGTGFNFSKDGNMICYLSNHEKEQASSTNSDLWLVSIDGKQIENITSNNKSWDGNPVYSPDGKFIAYKTQLIPNYESDKFRLAIFNLQTKKSEIISEEFDNWINDFAWSSDSKSIYFSADVKGYNPIFKIDVSTKKIEKITKDKVVGDFELSKDENFLYYNSRSMDKPNEIFKLNLKTGEEKQLTFLNQKLLDEVEFRSAEQLWIKCTDNKLIHLFLLKPHNFEPTKKYPMIINVHGGPQSQWMDAFRGDAQMYPGYGYINVFPNPHGSTGYGQDFTAAISGDWAGKVFDDIMMITDSLEKLPYVDKDRIGAMGWSYGGYFMNWIQGHTKRFKCLASMMGLYNVNSFYGTTEELWFPEWDLKGTPWNSNLYEKFNPANFVKQFSTPTLIITGEKDFRVSYTQSLEYFTALQKLGIESRLIIFKNDGHWPSHIKSMPLYYNSHLEWFHKFLGGEPAPYDSEKMIKNMAY